MQLLKLPKNQKIYLKLNDIKFNKTDFENYLKTYEDKDIKIKQTGNGFVYFKKDEPDNYYSLKDTTLYNVMIDYIQTQIVDKTSIKELVDPKKLKEYEWLQGLGIDFNKEFHQQMLNAHFKNLTIDTPILTPIQFLLTYYPKDFQQKTKIENIQSFFTSIKYKNNDLIVNNFHPFLSLNLSDQKFYQTQYLSYLKTMINELDIYEDRKPHLLQTQNSLNYVFNEFQLKDTYNFKDVYTHNLDLNLYIKKAQEIEYPYNETQYNDLLYLYNHQPNDVNVIQRLDTSIKLFLKSNPNAEILQSGYLKDVLKYKFNYDVNKGLEKSKDNSKTDI